MSLTKKDLQLIREVLKPDFLAINEKFEVVDKRFNEVDKRFDKVDKHFDEVDIHFERVESRLDKVESRLTGVEGKVDSIENTLTAAFREIVNDIYDLHPSKEEFNHLDDRVSLLEQKIH